MATISKENEIVTVINVFTVEPQNQQRLVEMLIEGARKTIRHAPGFVSVNIHRSLDGVRAVNYAQWRAKADVEAIMKNPQAQEYMKQVGEIAKADSHVYEVIDSFESL